MSNPSDSPIAGVIGRIYSLLQPPAGQPDTIGIVPHVGTAFTDPSAAALRVMAVGINSYYAPDDPPRSGRQYAGWVKNRQYAFFKTVASECAVLGSGAAGLNLWPGAEYGGADDDTAPLYVTNAVKRYLPTSEGKEARQVKDKWFAEGRKVFDAELACLADHGALPHIVVAFGEAAWKNVWPAFYGDDRPDWVTAYQSQPEDSELFQFVNVVTVSEDGVARPMLLLRLSHPSARGRPMTAERMLGELNALRD